MIEPDWPPPRCPNCGGDLTEIVTMESSEPVAVICDDACGWRQSRAQGTALDVSEVPS